jgi:polyhydroxyalkanoate synthesis repressor PhaR
MKKALVLKKYANRRLYDTERSLYVTLQEVAEAIREGRQVAVHDAQTKEDVTAFILTQIILEEAKNKNTLLPVPVLHLIIRFGNNLLGEFFENYLQQIIQAYLSQKAVFEQHFKQWISSGVNWSGLGQSTWSRMGGLKALFDLNPYLRPQSSDAPDEKGTEKGDK